MHHDSYLMPELARQRGIETARRAQIHRPWREQLRESRHRVLASGR